MIILIIYSFLVAIVAFIVLFSKPFLGKNKKVKAVIIIVAAILIWNHMPYYYDNDKTVSYVTSHAAPHSRSMCAWYVIKAMWQGGMIFVGQYPRPLHFLQTFSRRGFSLSQSS